MKPLKPLFLKTYGKQKRKLSAWICPENRRQAFDSTSSTDGDSSVFEPEKTTRPRYEESALLLIKRRTSVASQRAMRPAKTKAMLCLTEKSDEENIPSPSFLQPAPRSRTTRSVNKPAAGSYKRFGFNLYFIVREKKTSVSSGRAVRPAKRKAMLCMIETSSDEENISRPPHLQPARQIKTTRSVHKKHEQNTLRTRKRLSSCIVMSFVHLLFYYNSSLHRNSRLVSVPGVLMGQKAQHVPRTSESEEDSMSTAKRHKNSSKKVSNVHPPSAGRFVTRRRRAVTAKSKPTKATSNTLNSSDDFTSGAFGSSKIFRPSRRRRAAHPAFVVSSVENSLNAPGAASFGTNPLREISLSESADRSLGPCSRKPIFCSTPSAEPFGKHLKPLSINDQSSMSVSCIGVLSTFAEDLDSLGQLVSQPPSKPPIDLHSEEKLQLSPGEQEPGDLFIEPKSTNNGGSCNMEAKSHCKDIKTENVAGLPSLNLLSADDSESSSRFVSAAGGLECLIEALKEKSLTSRCTVQLERLDGLATTQLCSQTTYSSCLGHSSLQTNEHPTSVDSIQTADLSQSSEPSCCLHLSVTNNETSDYLQSENSSESHNHTASVTDSQSIHSSPSVDCEQSAEHSSSEEPMEKSASVNRTDSSIGFIMQLPANCPEKTRYPEEGRHLIKTCTVWLKKWALPPQPQGLLSENNHSHHSDAPKDLMRSGEITERLKPFVRQSVNNSSSAVAQTPSNDPDTEEKAAALTAMLKNKCLSDKLIIQIKRETLSQLKEILQLRGTKLKSPTDASDSGDDQSKGDHQSESDANHCNEDTAGTKVNIKKRVSSSSEEQEKKRRSMSADRPGTTRKACVSGLSVSRWKSKGSANTQVFGSRAGGNKAVDCSISELISTQHKQPRELLGTTMNFSTPARASRLNLSSLLADFTPNTHTWSRLKAALSVHRKGMVLLTPKTSCLSGSPGRTELADLSQDLFATPIRTPIPKRFQSQLLSGDSLVVCEDADLSDAEKVYAECGQKHPLPWEECIIPQRLKRCVKIGEGTFGEVFSTTNSSGDTVALKIIPVEGSEKVNGEDQKTFGEILHEIIISKELSSLKEKRKNQTHGFIGLNDLHCVQGCYPPDFMKAWDKFDRQKGSENDRPDFFEKDQLFIILEFEFGGVDLENSNGTLASLGVAKSILHQVTAALAVAEQELRFEHRDLHWGNVLVKTTKQKTGSFHLNGAAHSVENKGVLVRIIDYSLSRLEIDDLTVSCDISKDEELFMGQGDYQFDIYRLMRQENGNNWSNYHPHTNVLWLHYLCSKLLSMKYRGSGGRGAKDVREELTRFYDNILQYSSATEALQNCPMFQ
ncbi:hypothetical protein L3Q82_019760 [Scortum barcoo]|uniref:Uncharacterized protein n=1 Tax=Scortum barcoo TaxID=214431 RepID=A0ACB8VCH2_9TELE|nr:hypothetical protein L3Q82_019760 [Scortum barcoo]